MSAFRFAVNVAPKAGILDPQGRAVEGSLGHLGVDGRVRRSAWAAASSSPSRRPTRATARAIVERLAGELFSNPLIEAFEVERSRARSSRRPAGGR